MERKIRRETPEEFDIHGEPADMFAWVLDYEREWREDEGFIAKLRETRGLIAAARRATKLS